MNRTAVIVQARTGSTRLPGKVLRKLGAKTVLAHVLARCAAIQGADAVVCATSTLPQDDPVAEEAARAGAHVFRGSESDVLQRYLEAARSVSADVVLRVTADCPLIDPDVCAAVIVLRAATDADYASNNMPRLYPHGLDCEACRVAALAEAAAVTHDPFDNEHVTPWLRRELGLKRARASSVEVRGVAADASCLPMLGAREFDLVFACAALHHTLKYPGAVAELTRIMKPGARLVLCETWGGNPLLNAARKLHARAIGEAEEQGEEIIMSRAELSALAPFFSEMRVENRNLLAMGKRLLRGRFEKSWARVLVRILERVDGALLAVAPPLRNWCGEAVITARRK